MLHKESNEQNHDTTKASELRAELTDIELVQIFKGLLLKFATEEEIIKTLQAQINPMMLDITVDELLQLYLYEQTNRKLLSSQVLFGISSTILQMSNTPEQKMGSYEQNLSPQQVEILIDTGETTGSPEITIGIFRLFVTKLQVKYLKYLLDQHADNPGKWISVVDILVAEGKAVTHQYKSGVTNAVYTVIRGFKAYTAEMLEQGLDIRTIIQTKYTRTKDRGTLFRINPEIRISATHV